MSSRRRLSLAVAAAFVLALPALAGQKSEQELVAQLSSPDEKKVAEALQGLEKQYPDSPATREKVVSFLADPREKVRRKAARVAGALHFDLSAAEMAEIAKLLEASDKETVVDGLKALRGLKSRAFVPKVLPLLASPDEHVKRDACRTLAEIGDASVIPKIEPLLADPNKKVQEDARDAIGKLKLQ